MSRYIFFCLLISFVSSAHNPENIRKIEEVCNLYITSLTDYAKNIDVNNSYETMLFSVFDYNSDVYIHQNDLFDKSFANRNHVDNYLSYIELEYPNGLDIEFGETTVLDCKISLNGKIYVFATVTKFLSYLDKTREIELIFSLYKNNDTYTIQYALFNSTSNKEELTRECSSNAVKEDRLKLELEHLKAADRAFSIKDYFNARRLYSHVLSFNSQNQYAIDGLNNCNSLLTKQTFKEEIENLIHIKNFESAKERLNEFQNDYLATDPDWIKKISKICKDRVALKTYTNNLKIADSKYHLNLYNDATRYYKNAKSYDLADREYIKRQIELCSIGSPEKALKTIKKAYDAAVRSKNNYLNTYKTYIKFQNSGLLSGDNYNFMCLMMEHKFSEIGKKMGYSRNQVKKLAVKYLNKAKSLNYDMSHIETQVMTKGRFKNKD